MTVDEILRGQEANMANSMMGWGGATTGSQGMMNSILGESMAKKVGGMAGSLLPDNMPPWLDSVGANGQAQQGMLGGLVGGAMGLGSLYLGMKQYGLAKDTLKHNKEMFYKNFDAQKRTTNASLEDRQKARIASNAGAYESVGSYMDKNGIK